MKTADLLHLYRQLDSESSILKKLGIFRQWAETFPDIDAARIIYFDNISINGDADTAVPISRQTAKYFPKEPAVLNGRSPLPMGLFGDNSGCSVTMYYPFYFDSTVPAGALLFRGSNPKKFLGKHNETLGLLASKTRDIIYAGDLKRQITDISGSPHLGRGISPDNLGNLLNFLNLPMYVTDVQGRFISVNRKFLEQFEFNTLEELDGGEPFFIDSSDWNVTLDGLMSTGGFQGNTTKVRTGTGKIRAVIDMATLVGKNSFGVLLDITRYKEANETLRDTVEKQNNINEDLLRTAELLKKTQTTAMKSLAMLAEYRDMETGNHLHRICELNRKISEVIHKEQPYNFHISSDYVEDIYISGMLHDIGKVGVPDRILLKPESLSGEEWNVMRKHTVWGWDILHLADEELGEQSFLTLASKIAIAHHERYDGTGYPRGLTGEQIPLSARISAISDVYDALTSRRPYKEAWSHEQAIEEIISEGGKHFDPVIVEVVKSIEPEIHQIKLNFPDNTIPENSVN